MAVKRSRSAARTLAVFEAVAAGQPIGVSALARGLAADKSAVQRDLMTLADAGWIRAAPGAPGQWELTPHILTLARPPHSSENLRLRARAVLEELRTETGETAYLAVPDGDHFIVLTAAESLHMLRIVPPVGIVIPLEGSATGRAVLPHLPHDEQARLLGGAPDEAVRRDFAETLRRGYAVNDEDVVRGAVALAAAIPGPDGRPVGALVLSGPADRLRADRRAAIGERLRTAAKALAQGAP